MENTPFYKADSFVEDVFRDRLGIDFKPTRNIAHQVIREAEKGNWFGVQEGLERLDGNADVLSRKLHELGIVVRLDIPTALIEQLQGIE